MTTTTETIDGRRGTFDRTMPVLWLFAAALIALVVLPLFAVRLVWRLARGSRSLAAPAQAVANA